MSWKVAAFLCVAAVAVTAGPQKSKAPAPNSPPPPSLTGNFAHNLTFVLQGSNLPTQDDHSAVDAFVKVFEIGTDGKKEEQRIGTTDVVKDNADPEWTNVFWTNWKRGSGQKWKFQVRDEDILDADDDVGEVVVDIDQYVANNRRLNVSLNNGGYLVVKETTPTAFSLYARNLPKKDTTSKSDPYAEVFWRKGKNGDNNLIGLTAVIDNEENPDWKEKFNFVNYQKGTDQWLYIRLYDQDTVTGGDLLGDLLVEVDPFVARRQTKTTKLDNSDNKATLSITPA